MKTGLAILWMVLSALGISCNDDDNNYKPDEVVTRAFEQKYPEATRVKWESKYDYKVVEFYDGGVEKEAWFDKNGNWYMTESDISFQALPPAVIKAFQEGEYALWRVEDVDKLERVDMETVYVIEVEQGKQEFDLYYTEDGTLVKAVPHKDNVEHRPQTGLSQTIRDYIATHYAGARIVEFEAESWGTEVDIYHDGRYKEVKFDNKDTWFLTEWDVLISEVPAEVLSVIRKDYSDYHIDDIDFLERAGKVSVYVFELERGNQEIKVLVDEAGNIQQ